MISFARKSEAIFFTLDYFTLLRNEMSSARKSEANFFSLDDLRLLRDFTL